MRTIKKSKKLDNVCYEIRGPVLERARQLEEDGQQIIKLNIGNLAAFDFAPPTDIVREMALHMPHGAGYTDSKGMTAPREAILGYAKSKHISGVTMDDIYIGNGASELIMMCMSGLLDDGDQVLVPAPDYPLWTAAVSLSGGTPVHYLCDESVGWVPDIDHINRQITPHTRAIVIINPNNPTGTLYPIDVLQQIIEIARVHQLIIFADEIYDNMLYDQASHTSIASLADDVLCVTINGLSKNYRSCGYRAGWMTVSGEKQHAKDYMEGLNMLASMRLCANTPGQFAIQAALTSDHDHSGTHQRLLKQRDLAYNLLTAIPGVTCVKPQAALYVFPKLDPRLYPIANDQDFAYSLLDQEKVLIVQGTGFNWIAHDHFRLVFLPNSDDLTEAIGRIGRFLEGYRERCSLES